MTTRDEVLEKVRGVPALPVQTVQLIDLIQSADFSIIELQRLIERDPGMTSNVLRMANSPAFRGVYQIDSIREALVRLGGKTVLQLAVASAVAPVAQQPVVGYDMPAGELLKHSVVTAATVTELSKYLKLDIHPRVYTAALLHDLGKIVLGTFLEVNAQPILELAFREKVAFDEAEVRVLGTDHAEVGAALLENWGLPPPIISMVRFHHHPESCVEPDRSSTELVHVADILGRLSGLGVGVDGLNYVPSADAVRNLRVTTQVAEEVAANMMVTVSDMLEVFEIGVRRDSYGD